MKNIAILVPTLCNGGAERVAANLSIAFSEKYNVIVIVHDGTNITYPYKGQLIDLELPPSKGIFNKIATLYKRVKKLREIKEKYKIDYTISHLPPSNLANILSRRDDKVFTYVHSMLGAEKGVSLKSKLKEKFIALGSDKIIVVSERARLNLIENYGINERKTVTIYNFIEDKSITEQCNNVKDDMIWENTIVCMGRLTKPKGQWHLIRAFSEVVKEIPNAKLIILGEGELRSSLESLSDKLGIRENINFVGFTNKPFEYIKKSTIFVSSSLWEGLPMALIEVAMCKKSIISTDCDAGCREILAPNTNVKKKTKDIEKAKYGILIPVCKGGDIMCANISDEERVMAKAIIMMLNNRELRSHYEGLSEELYKRFLSGAVMSEWIELFDSIDNER